MVPLLEGREGRRSNGEWTNGVPSGTVSEGAAETGGAASSERQTICGFDSPGQSVVGGADGGTSGAVQTIQGLIPLGQPVMETGAEGSAPASRSGLTGSGPVEEMDLGGNPRWSEVSEEKKEHYLKPIELPSHVKPHPLSNLDISLAIGKRGLTDAEKMNFLTKTWQPDERYEFYPILQHHNRFPSLNLLHQHQPHLAFSHVEHGFFCVPCVLFGSDGVGKGGHQGTGRFSKKANRNLKDFGELWKGHRNTDYHINAALKAEDFEKIVRSGGNVKQAISTGYSTTVKKNRRMIKAIFKAIRFCARNELALRGHNDGGRFAFVDPGASDGIFRQTLRLMVDCGDADAKLVLDADSNATYLSPEIQNEMIECLSIHILHPVVQRINSAKCFTILADETGQHEREFLTICVRYLADGKLREDFIGFVSIAETTGEVVADNILNRLADLGIDPTKMVGQGYDGAANMAGRIKGVQKRIRDHFPMALYLHCVSHNLNLALSDAAATLHINRAIDGVHKVSVFFAGSAKRSDILRKWIEKLVPASKRTKIAQLAPTRWVQRHETLVAFKELLPAVLAALKELNKDERDSAAYDLLNGLSTFSSVFSILVAEKVASSLKFLATILQAEDIDLLSAYNEIDTARHLLESWATGKEHYNKLFQEAKEVCKGSGINDEILRWGDDNPTVLADYVEEKIYRPYLEALISGIKERFGERQRVAFKLQAFLPARLNELKMEEMTDVINLYESLLPNPLDIESEVERWKMRWKRGEAFDFREAFSDQVLLKSYPNVLLLLQILYTLPVSTATPERTFSTLGRIYTDERASMLPKRVSHLAIVATYKKEVDELDLDEVVDEFSRMSKRRLELS